MKKLLFMIPAAAMLFSCGGGHDHDHDHNNDADSTAVVEPAINYYGEQIDAEGAMSTADFKAAMADTTEMDVKLQTTIIESCQKMGCWMSVDVEGDEMMVYMNDHSFFVPKQGVGGLNCIVEGTAYYDTLSVEFLQHLAEDANKSQEEIDAITEPEYQLAINAMGVIIEGYEGPADEEMQEAMEEHSHDHEHDHGDESHDHEHDHGDEDHAH